MKGAKGLLISITGGRDLTLYEVDEAATRIREEVDQEANIIVGATFDEGLEGIIRVSVVATGIDHIAGMRPIVQAETRIAELTQKLRTENQRGQQLADHAEQGGLRQAAGSQGGRGGTVEQAAAAAVAAAVLPGHGGEDVRIRPIPPKPTLFVEQPAQPQETAAHRETPKAFIPPQAERIPNRGPRMPRIDELPLPAQNQIRAKRGELTEEHPEKRRMSLLQRIAAVGLGRREEEPEAPRDSQREAPRDSRPQMRPAPQPPERVQMRPAQRPQEHAGPEPVSEYARRPAPQGLDMHGRAAPAQHHAEDDQLDIPAFLRRQAN
jgi:cell division protein FtsZ